MPACAFAHHSTAANAAARRAARSPLATHRAPLYCAARRSRRRPRPALPPQLDWPDPWAETNWAQTESKCGDSVSTAQRNQGCEMRFAGVRNRNAPKQHAGANECSHLGRAPKLARLSFGTLGLRGMRGMRLAINVFVASKLHSLQLSPHTRSASCPTCR